jgi:hypothetical protein
LLFNFATVSVLYLARNVNCEHEISSLVFARHPWISERNPIAPSVSGHDRKKMGCGATGSAVF